MLGLRAQSRSEFVGVQDELLNLSPLIKKWVNGMSPVHRAVPFLPLDSNCERVHDPLARW